MKTKLLVIAGIALTTTSAILLLMSFKNADAPKQTEEYAFVAVREYSSGLIDVYTTIGEKPTTLEVLKSEKTKDKNLSPINYALVMKKLHELNAQGFTLVSFATSTEVVQYWNFMFKRTK